MNEMELYYDNGDGYEDESMRARYEREVGSWSIARKRKANKCSSGVVHEHHLAPIDPLPHGPG